MSKLTHDPVGKSVLRVDAIDKVTGAALFADDLQFGPGLLYGRLVRSPFAHALIRSHRRFAGTGFAGRTICRDRPRGDGTDWPVPGRPPDSWPVTGSGMPASLLPG